MKPNEIPYQTPFNETAIDRAKDFCKTRKLTPNDVKLVKSDGDVMVIVKQHGVKLYVARSK